MLTLKYLLHDLAMKITINVKYSTMIFTARRENKHIEAHVVLIKDKYNEIVSHPLGITQKI